TPARTHATLPTQARSTARSMRSAATSERSRSSSTTLAPGSGAASRKRHRGRRRGRPAEDPGKDARQAGLLLRQAGRRRGNRLPADAAAALGVVVRSRGPPVRGEVVDGSTRRVGLAILLPLSSVPRAWTNPPRK